MPKQALFIIYQGLCFDITLLSTYTNINSFITKSCLKIVVKCLFCTLEATFTRNNSLDCLFLKVMVLFHMQMIDGFGELIEQPLR